MFHTVCCSDVLSDIRQAFECEVALFRAAVQAGHITVHRQRVPIEKLGESKGCRTLVTTHFHLSMRCHMLVQLLSVLENLLAFVAHELVLLAVGPQMHVESIRMGEHLPTYVTCLEPLACVNSHVVFQLLLLGEHNLTNRTSCPLLPSVGPLVAVTSPLVTEGHLAELALVRLDPEVDSNVALQVALLHKLLGAVRTLVPRTYMDQHVLVKAVPPVKLFSTVVALVLLLACGSSCGCKGWIW